MTQIKLFVFLVTMSLAEPPALAWNIPGHMLSGAIAYQVLQQESPQTIDKVKAVLEKHPWYANQWQARLQDVPVADHSLVLFMQATRWADDIRTNDKQQHRALWHYINWPFKPDGQPASIQTKEPEPANILTAMAENERIVRNETDPESERLSPSRGSSTLWATHISLCALRSCSVLSIPRVTEGGNEICVRVSQGGQTMNLHRFWERDHHLKPESDPAMKRDNDTAKSAGVSASPIDRPCKHRL